MKTCKNLISLILIAVIAAACTSSGTPTQQDEPTEAESARKTLIQFFEQLNAGQYDKAAELYGGGYEVMIEHNPSLDAEDHAALFQAACQINGAQCLKVKSAVLQTEADPSQYTFLVEFSNPDGSLFVQGPCCGGNETDFPPESQFPFRVVKDAKGKFTVMDMPVYTP